MDLRHLDLPRRASSGRSTSAGRRAACGVSQPTLSAGHPPPREEVGFPVVRRAQRYEGLTPEGESVLEWARRILADVDGLDAESSTRCAVGSRGQLRIGAIPTSLPSRARS